MPVPRVSSDEIRKARKEHKCCECQRVIKVGEKYHLFKGCWDGEWGRFKTCVACNDLRYDVREGYRDDEWPAFGELEEWAREAGLEFPPVPQRREPDIVLTPGRRTT